MEINEIKKAVEEIKTKCIKRNFNQSVDLIINLRNIDVKKTPISSFHSLKYGFKKVKICCFSDEFVKARAEKVFDRVIGKEQLNLIVDKKEIKKLAREYDFFVAQIELMPLVASKLGKFLGSRGKMPNPAAGCVFAPNADLEALKNKLQLLKRIQTKNDSAIRICVGKEDLKEEYLVGNIKEVYDYVLSLLPEGKNNVKSVMLKLTMGPVYRIGVGFKAGDLKNLTDKNSMKKEISLDKKDVNGGVKNG